MVDAASEYGRGRAEGQGGGNTSLPQRTGGAPWKGEGRSNRRGRSVEGRGPPSSSIPPHTPKEGGDPRGSAGGKPQDCVEARRAAATSALSPTVSALSVMFRDVLHLL